MKFKGTVVIFILILIIFIVIGVPGIYYILPIFYLLTFLLLGVINIQRNYFLTAYNKSETSNKEIALTFDDGPHPEFTPQVLDILRGNNIKATFFCIGENAEQYPELVKRIHEEGHTLGNHSFTHSQYIDCKMSKGWIEEIEETDHTIFSVIGREVKYFRPPYGITTPHIAKALKKTKHKTIGWSVRPYDTIEQAEEKIIQKIKLKTKEGDIILLHDTHSRIIPVLKEIIPYFQLKKYDFLTIDELIK